MPAAQAWPDRACTRARWAHQQLGCLLFCSWCASRPCVLARGSCWRSGFRGVLVNTGWMLQELLKPSSSAAASYPALIATCCLSDLDPGAGGVPGIQ